MPTVECTQQVRSRPVCSEFVDAMRARGVDVVDWSTNESSEQRFEGVLMIDETPYVCVKRERWDLVFREDDRDKFVVIILAMGVADEELRARMLESKPLHVAANGPSAEQETRNRADAAVRSLIQLARTKSTEVVSTREGWPTVAWFATTLASPLALGRALRILVEEIDRLYGPGDLDVRMLEDWAILVGRPDADGGP